MSNLDDDVLEILRDIVEDSTIPLKQRNQWKDLDYTIEEARTVMKENGFETLPSGPKLRELGYSGLCSAIARHHDGFHKFRELLGEEEKRKEMGVWQDLDYTIKQARKVMGKNGFKTLPSYRKLVKLRKHSLANAINRYHGTFPEFRRILGEKQKRREDNIWQDLDYTIEQARTVMKENGFETLPSGPKLRVLGYSSLGAAIYKHHGGFPTFRKILGEEQLRKKRGIWQNRDYAIEQARKVMDENGFDKLPSQEKLNELGYSSLASSIHKYHGGFPTFRIYINEYNLNLKQSMGESQDG